MSETVRLADYRLIARLGQGGTADVFLAVVDGPRGSGFAKVAVVKRLRPHLAEDPEFISMLVDEGKLTARLSHANIVRMYEVGRDGDDYFLALEHLDGQPLHHIERRATRAGKPLPPETHYGVLTNVLAGLHHAHELHDFAGAPLHVVHRDVTPQNVFVTYDGVVKVVDFGIAKAMGRLTQTRHGIVKGKVRYMSPEQASGAPIDRRTDIFAVGIMLYRGATGKRLFASREDYDVARALVAGDYDPSPRSVDANVPEEIDRICRKALAFRPADRFATAAEMQSALEQFLGRCTQGPQRELGETVRELFAADREKLRTLLAGALGSVAASPLDLEVAPAKAHEKTKTMTVVMSSSTGVSPSVAPLSVPVAQPSRSASRGRLPAERPRKRDARRSLWSRLRPVVEWGAPANLLLIAVSIVVTLTAAILSAAQSPGDDDERRPRIVTPDRVSFGVDPATSASSSASSSSLRVHLPKPKAVNR